MYSEKDDIYPKTKEEHIGIEIECFLSDRYAENLLQEIEKDPKLKDWVVVTDDGSIDTNKMEEESFEVKLLSPWDELKDKLERVCNILNSLKAKVNSSCGLHVHLDCRGDWKKLKNYHNNLTKNIDILLGLVPKSRHDNEYCEVYNYYFESTNKESLKSEINEKIHGRFAINPYAYLKHETLEIRLHSGTTDFTKIYNWCRIVREIAKQKPEVPETFQEKVLKLNLGKELTSYIFERNEQLFPKRKVKKAA